MKFILRLTVDDMVMPCIDLFFNKNVINFLYSHLHHPVTTRIFQICTARSMSTLSSQNIHISFWSQLGNSFITRV
ncbi:hypothetical protein HanIR_Chr10g0502241 [Helianthus annuus]|nr:hypothetical protein HanIR_Chr10g0502241 [Helianthus annuus]